MLPASIMGGQMEYRTRVFLDFWNFQLNWNQRCQKQCDWVKLPHELIAKTKSITSSFLDEDSVCFEEIRVYASIDKNNPNDTALNKWLYTFLDMQTGFGVFIRERKSKQKQIHCKNCNKTFSVCPECDSEFKSSLEKGVDSAIVTDLFTLFLEDAYNIGILVSSDSDYIPAVEKLQDKGIKIINASWKNYGYELSKKCWASFHIDDLIERIER